MTLPDAVLLVDMDSTLLDNDRLGASTIWLTSTYRHWTATSKLTMRDGEESCNRRSPGRSGSAAWRQIATPLERGLK